MADNAEEKPFEHVINNHKERRAQPSKRRRAAVHHATTWPRDANGHFLPSANPAPKRDRRPLWKRIQDEVIEGLGGADKVPAHLRRIAKLYSRLQAEIEQADLTGKKLSVMIGNAARLRRQMGLDVPLKRLPRVDRDQSYRDYLTDGDAVETQDTRSENDGSA